MIAFSNWLSEVHDLATLFRFDCAAEVFEFVSTRNAATHDFVDGLGVAAEALTPITLAVTIRLVIMEADSVVTASVLIGRKRQRRSEGGVSKWAPGSMGRRGMVT